MKRSIKVCHSKTRGFPLVESIYHAELDLDHSILSTAELLMSPGSFMRVEFFRATKSVFGNDSFNMIDIYSVYRSGRLFFNESPIPWESDSQISWEEYRRKLVAHVSKLLSHCIGHGEGLDDRYVLCTKLGLLPPVCPRNCGKELQRLSKELDLMRRLESLQQHGSEATEGSYIDEAFSILASYRGNPELEIRFVLEAMDMLPFFAVRRMAENIPRARRCQAILLYYRVYLKSLEKKKYRTAFLFSISASRLLKQGINLGFEESIKLGSTGCIRERNWRMVLRDVMSKVEELDACRYGVNPYRLCGVDRSEFIVKSVELDRSNVAKCSGNAILFNGESTRTYFTEQLRIRILFSRISCANIHGVSGSIAGAEIFMPVYKTLRETSSTIHVIFSPSRLPLLTGDGSDEFEMRLEKLVFSGKVVVPIDLTAVWIRRKSAVYLKSISPPNKEGKVFFLLTLSNLGGFASSILGPSVIERNGCEVTVLLDLSQGSKTCLRHEVSEDVFETLELTYHL
ncbi:hypothetical protein J0A71_05g10720 [Encephalitozoon cuniculi]|uniref:Uncharacterized protein n=1 Tax=Encephalitozoon cuniculi TaxID=6035 RepID=M1JK04_ENCCN|nr:hypothetical protein ECU07_0570 [Encephalitozoon cuniculi]UYI27215.1 hypothetical protein J0A71_05g10720 [Encephalitozoon cuniculi]